MPRTLIYGSSWIPDQPARWVLEQWVRITRKLNPGVDVLIVDSASPAFPEKSPRVVRFDDNIGALVKGGRDGWGRAFCAGLQHAIDGGYEWAVFAECDLLLARPVTPIIDRMVQCGVKAACPMANPYAMIETALTFMDVAYMQEIDFIRRYDWGTAPGTPLCEFRVEELLGDRFMALPLRGMRNDLGGLTPRNIRTMFSNGCDYLTHCSPAVFRAMLDMNGLSED
jgi:hypothetical protein